MLRTMNSYFHAGAVVWLCALPAPQRARSTLHYERSASAGAPLTVSSPCSTSSCVASHSAPLPASAAQIATQAGRRHRSSFVDRAPYCTSGRARSSARGRLVVVPRQRLDRDLRGRTRRTDLRGAAARPVASLGTHPIARGPPPGSASSCAACAGISCVTSGSLRETRRWRRLRCSRCSACCLRC